jgi:hypothetical protein
MSEIEAKETITIGDKVYDKDSVTPSAYFEYVKGLKQNIDYEEYDIVINTVLDMLKKTKITGQTAMAKELTHQLDLALKELNAAKDGFDIFVLRKDIEKYISDVEAKSIKIIELENYIRDIPDDVIDKIELAKKHFDKIYIVFTDYTMKETKKVAKHRRDKDPIMFGAFVDDTIDDDSRKIYIEDKMFFIADWIEENCDLTLEDIVRDVKKNENRVITYTVSNPKDEKEVKALLESYTKPAEENKNIKPKSVLSRIKRSVAEKKKIKEKLSNKD